MTTQTAERRRALRWVWRAPLVILVVWVVASTVNQLVTGNFWFGGLPNPLAPLLFFAGPPLLLTTLAWLALTRAGLSRVDRLLLAGAVAVALLVSLHLLLAGRAWPWILVDLMPPVLYVLLPLALLVAVAVRRPSRPVAVLTALLSAGALALGVGQAGLNFPAADDGPAPPGALHVVSWDTLDWTESKDPEDFYRFVTSRHADVYLLQSYARRVPDTFRLTRDADRLRRAFPGYHFATAGNLLTISRFPIVAEVALETNPVQPAGTSNIGFLSDWKYGVLRTDLNVRGRTLSVYNVFFYDRFFLHAMPMSPTFFENIHGLDDGRRQQLDRLLADVHTNRNPFLVAGNFNLLPNTNDHGGLAALKDAGRADDSLYPVSLTFFGLPLWRMDWTFTSNDIGVHSYDLVSPDGLSSRHLQDVVVSLRPR
jgi:endonuclease/exonuclease/phosphatase (EEP) superfamily protein YafD